MITKKTALKEAGRFAAALEGPPGPRPMQRVVAEFLPFFDDLRADGASWTQIASLLSTIEVRSRRGKTVTADVLRAMVSRAARSAPEAKSGTSGPATTSGDARNSRERQPRISGAAAVPASSGGLNAAIISGDGMVKVARPPNGIAAKSADVAARIQRAAQLRR